MFQRVSNFVAICLGIIAIGTLVQADAGGPGPLEYSNPTSGIAATSLTSDAVSGIISTGGFDSLQVAVSLTDADTSITSVDVSCETSKDGTNRFGWITAKNLDGATGISTSKKYVDRLPNTGSTNYVSTWAVNANFMRCTFHANGSVTALIDIATVDYHLGAN